MYNKEFYNFLVSRKQHIFIEAEGKKDKLTDFIQNYNSKYNESVSVGDNGICLLGDVDKWGIELRIYFNDISNIPDYWNERKYHNRNYKSNEFTYRLDDKQLVYYLFDNGYRLGYND